MSPVVTASAADAAIEQRLKDNWTATPISWPNVKYEPTIGEPYIEPIVNHPDRFNNDLGSTNTKRATGLLTINIRTPKNQGDGVARTHRASVVTLFDNVAFSNLHFRAAIPKRPQNDPQNDAWRLTQVDCPFTFDSIN